MELELEVIAKDAETAKALVERLLKYADLKGHNVQGAQVVGYQKRRD